MGFHTDGGELGAVDANHAQVANLSTSPEVEEGKPDDADLLVRDGGTTANEAGGVLAGTNLEYVRRGFEWRAWTLTINTLGEDMVN